MEFIIKIANNFVRDHLSHSVLKYEDIIDLAKSKLYEIDNQLEKIKFVNVILEANNKAFDRHKPKCDSPETCLTNLGHESINYFLLQELVRQGVQISNNTFTNYEKISTETKLDKILSDIEELKMGHQIIYDDLIKELNELKELFFLGKKNWHQLLAGKCLSMVASGIISETISKEIINSISTATKLL
jgi:hypothetical protein